MLSLPVRCDWRPWPLELSSLDDAFLPLLVGAALVEVTLAGFPDGCCIILILWIYTHAHIHQVTDIHNGTTGNYGTLMLNKTSFIIFIMCIVSYSITSIHVSKDTRHTLSSLHRCGKRLCPHYGWTAAWLTDPRGSYKDTGASGLAWVKCSMIVFTNPIIKAPQ